jgi:IS4 transposase
VDKKDGILSDQIGVLGTTSSREAYPWKIRRVRYRDMEQGKVYVYLTNLMSVKPETIAVIYKMRWDIELFFRWIKQHLRIRHFYGNSPNAVKTQIWISVIVYLTVAILHKELKLPGTLHRTFQVLSVNPFSQTAIHELLMESDFRETDISDCKQLMLWDL